MFEKLFTSPSVVRRHENAPYREEREQYLQHCTEQGYTRSTLLLFARELLWIVRKLRFDPEHGVTLKQVRMVTRGWAEREGHCGRVLNIRWTNIRFEQVARPWLRFLGHWREPSRLLMPFASITEDYKAWMEHERGFSPATMRRWCGDLHQFLLWYSDHGRPISAVCQKDIDAFLYFYAARGSCRITVKNMAAALRAFFRYAGSKGLCSPSIAGGIHGPRIFAQENLPSGPRWHDVQRLIESMETDQPRDIRDRVMVMLFAIYGFRATEVITLRLEDIDWERNLISISRVKRRGKQTYPLIPSVGNALIRYLREVRPPSSFREVFLTLVRPFRPLGRGALQKVTSPRIDKLGIDIPHKGPHSLRHACASHLVAEGFSLKEIGDHLGHQCSSVTRIYAKVDLPSLREVATFDLGGLL